MSDDKRTPLYDEHVKLGARIVPFAGFQMPVQYGGVVEEHLAVRQAAGLFDVSHMGEFEIDGPDALANVDRLTPNRVLGLADGQAQYSALLTERGTFVDDILIYRRAADKVLMVVNASNVAKDFAWVNGHLQGNVRAADASDRFALLALQGPRAVACLAKLTDADLASIGSYHFLQDARVAGVAAIVSRTGYTGEDGFELYVDAGDAVALWRAILEAGAPLGVKPCGLGARDTLRLEARLPLYGNDIDDTHTPIEAGLNFIVKLDKGPFVGREALLEQSERGPQVKLAGFEMQGREIGRHGYPVYAGGAEVGPVTSGSYAPFLRKNVGLAYLPEANSAVGSPIEIGIRDRRASAAVVRTPFYKRPRSVPPGR
ncbi:MAG: glycine cleavage system aminomethyltransferase GcvT [Acidobacteriota bacterium]